MKPARVFWLHVHYFGAREGSWAVQQGGRYLTAKRVDVAPDVALSTVERKPGRQPRGFLRGRGVVRRRPGRVLVITRD
jgi:hypothetical protein